MSASTKKRAMRDTLIETLTDRMGARDDVYFLSSDLGAPALDRLRERFPKRFINMGIAEANTINVGTGLALEGYKVFAFAIAPFASLRAIEQSRTHFGILSQIRPFNFTLIGLAAGFSYEVSGPTHHSVEDLAAMRVIPNLEVHCPSDHEMASQFVDYALKVNRPKYIRIDGMSLPRLYDAKTTRLDFDRGFTVAREGEKVCIVATGFMVHKALAIATALESRGLSVAVIDLFKVTLLDFQGLSRELEKYQSIFSLEEAFVGKGGLDATVYAALELTRTQSKLRPKGLKSIATFDMGGREALHQLHGLGLEKLVDEVGASA